MIDLIKHMAKLSALGIQSESANMTGTELYDESMYIPSFKIACKKMNMLKRKAGFVCKSSAGRVVFLIQPYDSDIYKDEPEELPALWGFKWSDDPKHALPFIAISTSPFMKGNCCTENGETFRSKEDNNVHAPSSYKQGWEKVEG